MAKKKPNNETAAAEISATRDKVLKDFLHAYLADTQAPMSDVEMVHEMSAEGTKVKHTFYFQIKEKASKSNLIIK